MNATTIIKTISATAVIAVSASLTSCIQPSANQQAAAQTQQAAAANPYAVPGLGDQQAQAPTTYQSNTPAPYQPLPGVPSDIPNIQTPAPSYTPPASTPSVSASATTHSVVKGESLWRISRKYGVTVDALKSANGLPNDNIWAGQKLNIPAGE